MLNDGAAGLADLKRCGGVTVVQNPIEAREREMPLSALAASDVDYQTPISELGALLKMLASEPRNASPPPPDDIRLEVDIALGRPVGTDETNRLGNPVALSCPDCGGVLSQLRRVPLRFRCQVGHAYTAEALSTRQEDSVDEAMRVALRIVEERATLTKKMAEEARRGGFNHSALPLIELPLGAGNMSKRCATRCEMKRTSQANLSPDLAYGRVSICGLRIMLEVSVSHDLWN